MQKWTKDIVKSIRQRTNRDGLLARRKRVPSRFRRALLEQFEDRRVLAPGDLDSTFGVNGIVRTELFSNLTGTREARDIAIQSDGKYVVVGAGLGVVRYLPDGQIDPTFGFGGAAAFGGPAPFDSVAANAVAIQSNGRIVVGGERRVAGNSNFFVTRYLANGSLDTTFGTGGSVETDFAGTSNDILHDLVIQPGGQIVAVGFSMNAGVYDFGLARYTSAGVLDSTFDGPSGTGNGKFSHSLSSGDDHIYGVALQADGNIVVAGDARRAANPEFALARFNGANGTLDTTFGTGGIVYDGAAGAVRQLFLDVVIQPDGKIVAAGSTMVNGTEDFEVRRYETNGANDVTFGSGGSVVTAIGSTFDFAWRVALQSDGKIVAAGNSHNGANYDMAVVRYNTNGTFDTTFDTDGKATADLRGTADGVGGLAIQSDGKIVLVGSSGQDFALVRFNSNGAPDGSIGRGDGKISTAFGSSNDLAESVAVQTDGRTVVVGRSYNGSNYDFAVARYDIDGTLDSTFDGDGKLTTAIGSVHDEATGAAIQPDGRIVVVGLSFNGTNYDFAVVRYNNDGTLDSTFDGDGKLTTDIGSTEDIAYDVAIQADGRIVVVGYSGIGASRDFAVARYNVNGTLDSTFDGDGKLTTTFESSPDIARSVAIQADGRIVVVGEGRNGGNVDFAVARYNVNGTLDSTFDGDGKLTTAIGTSTDYAESVALRPDGRIVVAGSSHNGANIEFAVASYNSNGTLDSTFHSDGKLTTAIGTALDYAHSVGIQADGRVVVLGESHNGSNFDFAISRYNVDGTLDSTFDNDGKLTMAFGTDTDLANSVAIQPDGKIVVVGASDNGPNYDFAIARFDAVGSLDSTFDNFKSVITSGRLDDKAFDTVVQPDGKIVVVGNTNNGSNLDATVTRYNANGSLDTTFAGDGTLQFAWGGGLDEAFAVTLQSDGKIVVVGRSHIGSSYDFAVARLNSDGSFDTTFSGDGKTTTQVRTSDDLANDVVVQPDGKILLGGLALDTSNGAYDLVAVRYNTDGTLDNSFNGNGIRLIEPQSDGGHLVLQPDGKIVIGGSVLNGGSRKWFLFRMMPNGAYDSSFAVNYTDMGSGDDILNDLAIQADGKIIAAGHGIVSGLQEFALARFNTDGTLDTATFSGDGKAFATIGSSDDYATSVAVQANGRIVVSGYSIVSTRPAFSVARFLSDGSLDTSFTGDGSTTTSLGVTLNNDGSSSTLGSPAYGMAIQPDGNIVVAGHAWNGADFDIAVARYQWTDTVPPQVSTTSPSLASGMLSAGQTSLAVTFSETVLGLAGAANYELRRAGADGLLGSADDPLVALSASGSTTMATLSFAGLVDDVYRLTVQDTITDFTPNQLDGDGNGSAGGDWVRDFVVNSIGVAQSPFRWAQFSSYDQWAGWVMNNNSAMFGGVAPSTWGDGNGQAYHMSTDPAVLATLFTNKGYVGANAMLQSDTWYSYSSTNSKHYAALFQVQNTTGSTLTWTPSFYYTAYSGWGELASVAVNGTPIWTGTSGGNQTLSISIPANSTSNVIFVSASNPQSGTRTNAFGFNNNSLALPAGLAFVDTLAAQSPFRWAQFSSYDEWGGWVMNNNPAMFGGVTPSNWGDGNAQAYHMSTDPAVLATLFTNKGYVGANAMLQSDTWYSYSSTNSKHYAALFQVQNSTGSTLTWTPSFYYTAYSGWGELASVAVNGTPIWTGTSGGNQTISVSLPANSTTNVIFVSASNPPSNTRTNALGFYNNSLALPAGLAFVDTLAAQSPFRWAQFSSYDQWAGWVMNNNSAMFGGVAPSTWGDGNGQAYHMSTDPAVLATLFTNKGYVGANAMLQSDTWYSYSSTNSKHYAALFQVQNTTGSTLTWTPSFYYTAYSGWGELASVAVNGTPIWTGTSGGNQTISVSLPANSTTNVIFVSASNPDRATRTNALGFHNNSLALPAGLTFVDQWGVPGNANLASPSGYAFEVDTYGSGTGQLVQGASNAFDGLNRLNVGSVNYAPGPSLEYIDAAQTVVTGTAFLSGLSVSREITVPNTGSQDFARTVDAFTNPSASPIATTVKIVGNLGSDVATTVFRTSDGDSIVEVTDQWIGTDDADGTGSPAVIHFVHGPSGLVPASVQVVGDNIEWTYNLTVPASSTVRLGTFTILDTTRAGAEADAAVLVTSAGFGGQAAAFLTAGELASLANFQFNANPTISDIVDQSTNEDVTLANVAFTVGDAETAAGSLTVSATSSDTTLIPLANITFGGSGASRTISLAPAANLSGSATITVTVNDGNGGTASDTFVVTVVAVNDNPTISDVVDQSTNEDVALTNLAFMIGDVETAVGSLTVSATSSDTTLFPLANITFGGSGASRTVSLTPAANLSGTATITVTVNDGSGGTASDAFVVTVTAVNDTPTISDIANQATNEDIPLSNLPFTVGDVETASGSLTVSASSSDTTLFPAGSITFGGSGANRTISLAPATNLSGSATITVTVNDGTATASDTFVVTVNAVNDSPTISDIANQTTNEDTPLANVPFTIGDVETVAGTLTVSASSSDTTLFPAGSITFGGSGANRTISLAPAANLSGSATITVTVNDGTGGTASDTFTMTVSAVNDTPTISDIANQSTSEDTPLTNVSFTIGDVESPAASLTVSATSSDTTLFPAGSITFGGSGASRTISLAPAANLSGSATITVTVNDGSATSSDTIVMTVNAVNDNPTISDIADQTTNEDVALSNLPFTIGDVETAAGSLTVSAATDNPAILPLANITFGGSGANRTITFSPAANQSGVANITVTVSDGAGGTAVDAIRVTVTAVNDAPTISDIANQATNEDTPLSNVAFTVGDVETAAGSLTVSASSSDTTLFPAGSITFGGSGASRTISLAPAPNLSGSATITVTVNDGTASTNDTFVMTVTAVNDSPTISNIANQSTNEDTPLSSVAFTIGDVETAAASLTVSATSSDTTLFPAGSITFGGSGASRTISLVPAANLSGSATITVTVNDGASTANDTFVLTVTAVNDSPTISDIANQSTAEDTPLTNVPFTIGDVETAAGSLTASATSSDTTLFPAGSITFGGSGSSRTISLSPATNLSGSATITVTVNDGTGGTASDTFVILVGASNDNPTISDIVDQTTNEDVALTNVAFTIGDQETPAASLTVSATSSNTTLFPAGSITFGGSGANRTISLAPAPNLSGSATITVTVNDGSGGTAVDTFVMTVTAVNDNPTISDIANQATNEDVPLSSVPFTIGDVETAAGSLTVSASSSDTTLFPAGSITFGGSGAARTISLTPAANLSGSATITVTVNDGAGGTAVDTFVVTVSAVNDTPTISDIVNQATNEDVPLTGVSFTIGDIETAAAALTVSATASDTTLFPAGSITFGGSGASRTISLAPAANLSGSATITVTVDDGSGGTASDTFVMTVNAVNDSPTISLLANQSTVMDTPTTANPFTIGDLETLPAGLVLGGTSSNTALVANGNIAFGGSGGSRTVIVTPTTGQTGTTTITVRVTDGGLFAESQYTVFVGAAGGGTLATSLVGSQLQITDVDSGGINNDFTITTSGSNLVLTDANEEFISPPALGSLSNGNQTLTIPLAGITSVVVNGTGGNDRFVLGSLGSLAQLALNGGPGNDTFGTATQKVTPSTTTAIAIDGGPVGGGLPSGDSAGDVLHLDVAPLSPATAVVVATLPGQTFATGYQSVTFPQIEDINLWGLDGLTNTQMGDVYVQGTGNTDLLQFSLAPTPADPNRIRVRVNNTLQHATLTRRNILYGGSGIDNITQSNVPLPAEFYGGDGDDVMSGGSHDDLLVGGPGRDRMNGGNGFNILWGDDGPTATVPRPQDLATGGNDVIGGGNMADVIYGGGGDDNISAGGGNDYVYGGEGIDTIGGADGDDRLYGGPGPDVIGGHVGNDLLSGGAGNDNLYGNEGNDVLLGGTEEDLLDAGTGNDLLFGGSLGNSETSATALPTTSIFPVASYCDVADNDGPLHTLLGQWGSASDHSLMLLFGMLHDDADDDLIGSGGDDDFAWELRDVLDEPPSIAPADFRALHQGNDERFGPT